MDIKNHIPSLETCKKMKELGWEKETLFYWYEIERWHGKKTIVIDDCLGTEHSDEYDKEKILLAPAPLASEIGEELPEEIKVKPSDLRRIKHEDARLHIMPSTGYKKGWLCRYFTEPFLMVEEKFGKTQAEALAKMWIYLKENKLI